MYGTCRTVSWNAIILNNINGNTVNSKQYTLKKTSNAPFIILSISSIANSLSNTNFTVYQVKDIS